MDVVIETKRGHNLGRVIREGRAIPNTGIPGNIGGYTAQRVLYASEDGVLKTIRKIGESGEAGRTNRGDLDKGRESAGGGVSGWNHPWADPDGFSVTKGFKNRRY